ARGGTDLAMAAERMAIAHCDRESRCGGEDARAEQAKRRACMDRLHDALLGAYAPATCGAGVDQARLDRCIAAIRGEACGRSLAAVEELEACRVDALCPPAR
ncbi:MAG TPA: DUF6184 family natural product biosynthesis lipoprotein, partial [Minicystis sp.]|nr:DUF6184 family natural product biosynthesis lipoprotein [Minicystis sp.]